MARLPRSARFCPSRSRGPANAPPSWRIPITQSCASNSSVSWKSAPITARPLPLQCQYRHRLQPPFNHSETLQKTSPFMIRTHYTPTHLAVAAFAGLSIAAFAGPPTPPPPIKPVEEPLLSFFGGKVVFDVQERVRWEIRENNFDFNDDIRSLTDDNWVLQRFRLGLMLKPTDWLKIYAQTQDSREWLSDRADIPGLLGAEGDDPFDLRQAYIEIGNTKEIPWGIKVGRQILSYGDERLIGAFDWNNIGRTFDAVKLSYKTPTWWVDAFASTVAVPHREGYNQSDLFSGNETEREQVFSGIYFSTTALEFQTTDLYALHLHEELALTSTNFVTLGMRLKSKPGYFADAAPAGYAKDGKTMLPPAPPKPVGFDYEIGRAHV